MKTEVIKLRGLEVNLQELSKFVVEAKKQGFAGGGLYENVPDGLKQFTFQKGDFYYTDSYIGELQFSGHETIRWGAKFAPPIWQMNYFGGINPKFFEDKELIEKNDRFLRENLMRVTPDKPFRGPEGLCCEGDLEYKNKVYGGIERFYGKEQIHQYKDNRKASRIFLLDYHGGIIIPEKEYFYLNALMPIRELELSVRATNCLKTIGLFESSPLIELLKKTSFELLQIKNFGKTSLREIRRRLGDLGLHLKDYYE